MSSAKSGIRNPKSKQEKSCVVLGGCGFLGSVITNRLAQRGWDVRVFDKEGTDDVRLQPVRSKIEVMRGDFMNAGDLRRALEDVSVVLHFIGTTIPQTSMNDIDFDIHTNVLATVQLLEIMRTNTKQKLVFSSSGGTVYGIASQSRPIPESGKTEPISAYGISKLMVEKYIQLFSMNYDLPYIILRFSNPFGENQPLTRPQGAVGVFLRKALLGETIRIWGDGSVTRDFLYQHDLANAVESVLRFPSLQGVFNVGSGKGTSLRNLIAVIEKLFNVSCKVEHASSRSFDVPYNVLDVRKIRKATGWKPHYSLSAGLKEMAAALGPEVLQAHG